MFKRDPFRIEEILNGINARKDLVKRISKITEQRDLEILDVGCGILGSKFVNMYSEKFPKTKVWGLDKRFYEEEKIELDFLFDRKMVKDKIIADARYMPFREECIDLAYAGWIIPHLVIENNGSYEIAKECYRVLRKGGLFVVEGKTIEKGITEKDLLEIGYQRFTKIQEYGIGQVFIGVK